MSEVRGTKATYKCARCGDPFVARTADRARGWARFCSKSCKAIRQTQRTGYRGPTAHRDERDGFVMSAADLASGGYGDAGPDDSFGDGKW